MPTPCTCPGEHHLQRLQCPLLRRLPAEFSFTRQTWSSSATLPGWSVPGDWLDFAVQDSITFSSILNINSPSRVLHQKENIYIYCYIKVLPPSFSIWIRTRRKQELNLFLEESTGTWRNLFLFSGPGTWLARQAGTPELPETAPNSDQGGALYLEYHCSWCWKASQMRPAGDIKSQITTMPLHLEDKSVFKRNLSTQVHRDLNSVKLSGVWLGGFFSCWQFAQNSSCGVSG